MPSTSTPIGRLAPSPTGRLHVGHARSFMIAWWSVRSRSGRMLLRMDDLDHTRLRPGMLDACLRDLEWLGLDWDGAPYLQSEHAAEHQAALDALLESNQAYACVCTRSEIASSMSAPHLEDGESVYPGTCRDRYPSPEAAELASGRRAGIRLCVPEQPVAWHDQFMGPQSTPVAEQVGDFLLARRDQVFAYQLACAVDDANLGITEVVRGEDLASSAPRQQLVQTALDLPSPSWAHVPLVTDGAGRRLAKRDGDLALTTLREAGLDPRCLVAWIAQTCGMGQLERPSAAELLGSFDLQRVERSPAVFTSDVLN